MKCEWCNSSYTSIDPCCEHKAAETLDQIDDAPVSTRERIGLGRIRQDIVKRYPDLYNRRYGVDDRTDYR